MNCNKYISVSLIIVASVGLLVLAVFLLSEKITLSSSDLGRHIQNGRSVFSQQQLLYTNVYSYTETDHSFLNSHWLSGVIFFWIYTIASWQGLSVFGLGLQLAAYGISFWLAVKRSDFWVAATWIIPVLLVGNERIEVRPELFTNLFLILYVAILWQWRKTKKKKLLWWLVPLQLLWINLHIYAFLGLGVIGIFLLEGCKNQMQNKKSQDMKHWWAIFWQWLRSDRLVPIFLLVLGASVLNPHGIKGVLFPLRIFEQYGYAIAENKSVFFMRELQVNFAIDIFLWLLAGSVMLLMIKFFYDRRWDIADCLIIASFGIFGILMLRNISMFGLLSLPIMSAGSWVIFGKIKKKYPDLFSRRNFFIPQGLVIGLIAGVILWSMSGRYFDRQGTIHQFGFGLAPSGESLGTFLQQNPPRGPIFNNYDIGSYLDWYLFTQQKVFVDNRPEAFSVDFFQRYRTMQTDIEVWRKGLDEYKFQTIIFTHTDSTSWAQTFLQDRLRDDQWQLVYVDAYALVLVKKTDENGQYIASIDSLDQGTLGQKIEALFEQSHPKQKLYVASFAGLSGEAELNRNLANRIVQESPNNFSSWVARASAYGTSEQEDDLKIAQRSLEKAIELGASLASVYNQLGVIQLRRGDFTGAQQSWQQALTLDDNNQTTLYYLSQMR